MFHLRTVVHRAFYGTSKPAWTSCIRGAATYQAENEPILSYMRGSEERDHLEKALKNHSESVTEIPICVGDEEIRTDDVKYQVCPFEHSRNIAKFYYASPEVINKAIDTSLKARKAWESMALEKRTDIFLKAADLLADVHGGRSEINAVTMLGQGKTVIQAEIDAACELIDFLRFNVMFAQQLPQSYQPISTSESKNSIRYRGLEGFIAAVSPFNFTAIGGNLSSAPAMMGNVVLWKPSDTAMLSAYTIYKVFREAGLPPGVINLVPADGPVFGDTITSSPDLAGINFTGSVATFRRLFKQVGQNVDLYKNYPKLVGECGGKNYHFVHKSADIDSVVNGTLRSAFEYSGQKCSACSRMYVSESVWPQIKDKLMQQYKNIKLGSPLKYDSFLSAVIDEKSFARVKSYLEHAKSSNKLQILAGGNYDDKDGYFVEPTIIESSDPEDKIMKEEIFGPVVTVYVYHDNEVTDTLQLAKESAPFGLTGAIFAQDRSFIEMATEELKMSAGNFYINDKSTGSVVGQQPFGGARISGTNDKAGGPHYVMKWTSPQAIKETVKPLPTWKYEYMTS